MLALLIVGLANKSSPNSRSQIFAQAERRPAPTLRLPLVSTEPSDGADAPRMVDIAEFRGRPLVLNFWASWCEPCKDEAPALNAVADAVKRDGVRVLGVNMQDVPANARRFLRDYRVTFPSVRDGSGATFGDFGVTGPPETFVIDRDGRIAAHIIGSVSGAQEGSLLTDALETVR